MTRIASSSMAKIALKINTFEKKATNKIEKNFPEETRNLFAKAAVVIRDNWGRYNIAFYSIITAFIAL